MRYVNLLSLFFLLCISNLNAQELKLAGIEYSNYPAVTLKEDANGVEAAFQEFGGFFWNSKSAERW